jgi:hypothetical protein
MAIVANLVWSASHRPTHALSPRRQNPSTPRINSPRRFHLSPTVRCDPTVPTRRQRAAGSAQSRHRVPTCTRPHPRRPAPKPTRHGTIGPLPPLPCPLAACTDPGEPGFSRARSEPEAAPTAPLRHRRSHLVLRLCARCRPSQPTTPPNGRRPRRTIDRDHAGK